MAFAVIDTETTGLFPTDRVVELGVVLVDDNGEVEFVVDTLVNPERDVASAGPQERQAELVHGISSSQVIHAPRFGDIADWLAHQLSGRLVLMHNAWFDLRFLDREFSRAELRLDRLAIGDTMRMSAAMLGVHALGQAARVLDVQWPGEAHCAAVDAQVTWMVAERLWSMAPPGVGLPGLGWMTRSDDGALALDLAEYDHRQLAAAAARYAYLDTCPPTPQWVPRALADGQASRIDTYLGRLMVQLPPGSLTVTDADTTASATYLDLLDRALADRLITLDEAEALAGLAWELGLTNDQVDRLHRRYLDVLVDIAHEDGVITALESDELNRVAALLGLPEANWASARPCLESAHSTIKPSGGLRLEPGDRVCFTGAMSCPRSELEALARDAGLVPGGLAKSTAVLVVADPNTQSGKAKKARAYGTTVVSEQVFRNALARLV